MSWYSLCFHFSSFFNMNVLIFLVLLHMPFTQAKGVQRLAIVRPFALADVARLATSFESWDTYLPCTTGDAASAVEVDLFLCFSQTLSSDPAVQAPVEAILEEFASGLAVWHSCIRNVYAISAGLLPSQDRYITNGNNGTNTAEGPNLQFVRIAEGFLAGTWGRGSYDSFMLMEMDTVPIKRGWLTAVIDELNANAPYAVYGSNYRGSRWDGFYTQLPPAVRLHINGNAVYNVTSPEFRALLRAVSVHVAAGNNDVAYDVFMAQVVLDGVAAPAEALVDHSILVDQYRADAKFLSNYVHMTMPPKSFGEEYLVHGVNVAAEWEPDADSIALVISDWGNEPELNLLLDALRTGYHPFREVIIYRPRDHLPRTLQSTEPITVNGTYFASMEVQYVERIEDAAHDWCSAPVTSTWMAYINVYFTLRNPVRLVRTVSGRPILHYSDRRYCLRDGACSAGLVRAAAFAQGAHDGHFDLHEMVFRTDKKSQFCSAWRAWYSANAPACDPILGPTADDYMAWLSGAGEAAAIYAMINKDRYDTPSFAVQQMAPPVDPRPCSFYGKFQQLSLQANVTGCSRLATQVDCESHTAPTCVWRAAIGSCYELASDGMLKYMWMGGFSTPGGGRVDRALWLDPPPKN